MDALRFRRRPLFRQQAVDAFVGVFGTGATPDLLRRPHGRAMRLAVLAVLAAWGLWGVALVFVAPEILASSQTAPAGEAAPHD